MVSLSFITAPCYTATRCLWTTAKIGNMTMNVTRILGRIQNGDDGASDELLPLVYDELRRLATRRIGREHAGTFQATELVHEAYVRLVDVDTSRQWDSRGHFFAAAAEAMRRILIDRARSRVRKKRGDGAKRIELDEAFVATDDRTEEMLAINEAISGLEVHNTLAADLVKLRFFVGMQHREAADSLGISRREADRLWVLARTWLYRWLRKQ